MNTVLLLNPYCLQSESLILVTRIYIGDRLLSSFLPFPPVFPCYSLFFSLVFVFVVVVGSYQINRKLDLTYTLPVVTKLTDFPVPPLQTASRCKYKTA